MNDKEKLGLVRFPFIQQNRYQAALVEITLNSLEIIVNKVFENILFMKLNITTNKCRRVFHSQYVHLS